MFLYTIIYIVSTKRMTKTQLREATGIGTNTLAKMSKGEYVTMEILDKICTYLQCNIEDVIKHQP